LTIVVGWLHECAPREPSEEEAKRFQSGVASMGITFVMCQVVEGSAELQGRYQSGD
jgi:hypothetical protein